MKNGVVILIMSRIIQIAISLLSLRLITSFFNNDELGTYYLFISLFMFASLSVLNPYGQYINRHTYKWRDDGILFLWVGRYIKFTFLFSFSFSIILTIYYLFSHQNSPLFLGVVCGVYIITITTNQFLLHTLNILNNRVMFSALTILTALVGLIAAYLLLKGNLLNIGKPYLWLFGIIIANFISLIFALFWLKKNERSSTRKNFDFDYKEIMFFCIPIAISTFFMWFINSGYRFGVETLVGLSYLGIIAVAFTVSGQIMTVVESLITQILQPLLFQKIDSQKIVDRIKHLNNYINETIAIYLFSAIFCSFFMHYIFLFLIDKKFIQYASIGIIAVWFDFFRISTNSLSMVFFSEKNMKKMITPYACGSFFLILSFVVLGVLTKNNETTSTLFFSIPFLIAAPSIVTFFIAFISIRKYGDIGINLMFLLKRVLFITPILAVIIFLPKSITLDLKTITIIISVSLGACSLFFLSLVKIKYPKRENES
ncbi:lipopolysaccharide biosynthesis protein [Pectobacterium punjabense]|uniref:lipopolysaccharide biosynthesis protein n=1 Tax=Pectobacterium punjabense TaxID=2108399 RepID=UPI0037FA88E6